LDNSSSVRTGGRDEIRSRAFGWTVRLGRRSDQILDRSPSQAEILPPHRLLRILILFLATDLKMVADFLAWLEFHFPLMLFHVSQRSSFWENKDRERLEIGDIFITE
jgi:hypothetical protein